MTNMHHILSATDLDTKTVGELLARAHSFEEAYRSGSLERKLSGKIVASFFFEPSTRTRLSFETAALRLGAEVISVENAVANSSAYKGETVEDTARMLAGYADITVMRHSEAGSVARAAAVSDIPVINAGDGANQHPSQALLDLYTIQKECGKLDGLSIVCMGDLKYSRTLHSLIPLLLEYPGNSFKLISPKELALPDEYKTMISEKGSAYTEGDDLSAALAGADVVYVTRVQKERFPDLSVYDRVKDMFIFKEEHLKLLPEKAIIMHPLPRVHEIETGVDRDKRAAYFRQAENGVYVRMALLCHALGI